MPTDYAPRSKPMHSREVRYERNDRFLGKRDWQRVAVFDRAPVLSSSNGGSFEQSNKRRAPGRHGFPGENGRCRDHNRVSEHPSMLGGVGYAGFGQKNDRYGPPGAMNHYPSSSGRNGLRDVVEEEYFRDRGEPPERLLVSSSSPTNHTPAIHQYGSAPVPDGQRGSRYGWAEVQRSERDHRERLSSSPDVFDRKVGISRYGGWGFQEKEIEGRHDRYGAAAAGRDPAAAVAAYGGGEFRCSRDLPEEFSSDPFVTRFHQRSFSAAAATGLQQEHGPISSPRKKTRLTWGDGLASYEQKHTSSKPKEEEPSSFYDPPAGSEAQPVGDTKGLSDPEFGDADGGFAITPVREQTPVSDVATEAAAEEAEAFVREEDPVEAPAARSPPCPDVPSSFEELAAETAVEDTTTHQIMQQQDLEECTVKVSKEDVVRQVEQLEFDIDSIEKELARLAVEVDLDAVEEVKEEPCTKPCSSIEEERPDDMIVDTEVDDHGSLAGSRAEGLTESTDQRCQLAEEAVDPSCKEAPQVQLSSDILSKCLEDFACLLPESVRDKRLYSNPQEAPFWARNEEVYQLNKYKILERMVKKEQDVNFKKMSLVLKYRLLKEATKNENHAQKGMRKLKSSECRNGLSSLDGEIVYEDPQLMNKLLLEPLCPHREGLRMPSMVLSRSGTAIEHIITSNRLVEDPVTREEERKSINPWTAEEKKVFVEKFGVFTKNFARIASFLPHKTTGDCVEFYYRNQKSEEFAKLRKKQQLKKRHSRASYLATTTSTGGRLRDSNAAAAAIQKMASAATYAGSNFGRLSRNNMKAVDKERPSLTSDCVTADAVVRLAAGKETRSGNVSAAMSSIVTGVCSLSSDAPLTPSRTSCERAFPKEDHCTKQKGVRSSRGRRDQAADDTESEWTDSERELFVDAVLLFGKDFRSIALHVRSRSEGQCKTFFSKARKRLKLDRIVEQHQLAQAAAATDVQPMAVVNREYEDPPAEQKVQLSEDMDVSVVVDSGPKEGNEAADTECGTSAAPSALVDSPVSSVITSPGLVSSSSPATIQASNTRAAVSGCDLGADLAVLELKQFPEPDDKPNLVHKAVIDMSLTSKPLTESSKSTEGNESFPPKSHKRSAENFECDQGRSGGSTQEKNDFIATHSALWDPEKQSSSSEMPSRGLVSVLDTGAQVQNTTFQKQQQQQATQFQIPPGMFNEQQYMMILQNYRFRQQLPRQLLQQVVQSDRMFLAHQQQHQQQFQHFQDPVKQESQYTNNQNLLALHQAYLHQEQLQKEHLHDQHQIAQQQQHLLSLLTQQQQLAVQLHQPQQQQQQQQLQQCGSFPQKVPGLQMLGEGIGPAAKYLTGEFGEPLHFIDRWTSAKPAMVTASEEQLNRSSDIKLFGQSLLSQPNPVAIKLSSEPSTSLTKTAAICDTAMTVPVFLGESWCSGSAEAQDRDLAARCGSTGYDAVNGGFTSADSSSLSSASLKLLQAWEWRKHAINGTNTSSSNNTLPSSATLVASNKHGSREPCTREALNVWRKELMKSGSAAASGVVGFCQQEEQQHQQQQQQQQGLKDGLMFPSHLLQFPNGTGW